MLEKLFSLTDRVALITGGNTGLGKAMALAFVAAGAKVAVTGRDVDRNRQMAEELGQAGAVFVLDVREEDAVKETVEQVTKHFGRLDILVNNAGYAKTGMVTELSLEEWHAIVDLNLTGSFLCTKYAAKTIINQGKGGKIINIGSIYSLFGTPNFASYGASKTGILGLTRALAIELAPHNIQVNAILPGYFITERTKRLVETPLGDQIRRKSAAGRWGQPQDLVGAAIFFAWLLLISLLVFTCQSMGVTQSQNGCYMSKSCRATRSTLNVKGRAYQ